MAFSGGVLIVGRVTEVDVRERKPLPDGEVQAPVHTVFVAGPRAVEETWGEDGGFQEGELVAIRCVPQLPSEKQKRLTWRRVALVTPEELNEHAKLMASERAAARKAS